MTQYDRIFGFLTVLTVIAFAGVMALWVSRLRRIRESPRSQWRESMDSAVDWLTLSGGVLIGLQCALGGLLLAYSNPEEPWFSACAMVVPFGVLAVGLRAFARAAAGITVQHWREGRKW